MGSYFGLNRLGLGLQRFQSAARWGWDRCCYCHTDILMQMKPRKSLWAQIIRPASPKISVKPKLDNWVKDEKRKPEASDLKRIVLKLRKHGRSYQALQVYEWMRNKGIYEFSSSDHAVQFNLICKVRGCSAAERYVRNLPKQARNDKTYGKLLHCYVHEHKEDIETSPLLQLQKMEELGFAFSPRLFNEILRIQAYPHGDHVLEVLAELKKSKVSPDNDSYRLCITSFGLKYDLDGMERMLREMETQPHIVMDWCTYAVVAEFYDREFQVDKATDALEKVRVILQKKDVSRKIPNYLLESDYENVIKALVKLGEFDEAMKFLNKWETSGNLLYEDDDDDGDDISIPYTIIEGCIKNGKLQDALYTIEAWSRKGKKKGKKIDVDTLSRILCKEYLKVGDVFQAFNCFRGTVHAFENPSMVDFEVHPTVLMLFFKYLEEECGSFFPLSCTGSVKTATGTILLEDYSINSKLALPVQHENSMTQAPNLDYENSIKSLVESGELNEARKMVIEWEASGNWRSSDFLNILELIIEGYCKKSLFMEAEAMAKAWTREKRSQVARIWSVLACNYQEQGKLVKGFECMRTYFNLTPSLKGNHNRMMSMFFNMIESSRGSFEGM